VDEMTMAGRWALTALVVVVAGVGAAGAAQAAKDRLVVDLASEPSTLDPQLQWNPDSYYVYRNIFDNLVTRDDKGAIAPQVAASWKYLSDTEIEFQLRTDILFHDGRKLGPEDVVFSIQRITDPAFLSPQRGQFDRIAKAEVTGPASVKLTTKGIYPVLLAQLVKLSIVPKHVVEAVGKDAFNLKPVGSGPYALESWKRGVETTLTRNEAYWGQKGVFKAATFRAVPDAATRLADLQSGASDLVVSLDSDLASQLATSPKAKRLSVLTERLAYLRLNPYRAPFDNPKIREAVARAVDKQGIVDGLLGGFDKPIAQMLTPVHFGWVEGIQGPAYDPEKAKALVREAGEAGKLEIPLLTAPFFDQRVVQAIQQMLKDVGLQVKIELTDTPTFLQRTQQGSKGSPIMAISRSSCACQDADGAMYQLFHSGDAWTVIENADLDGWLEHARSVLDPAVRLADYRKVHELIAKELPVVPLYQTVATYGAAKALVWSPTPNESLFLNRMGWAE
jgi:peptide/nickel transport system substrate-binding protein